jgi:hypothetical protein
MHFIYHIFNDGLYIFFFEYSGIVANRDIALNMEELRAVVESAVQKAIEPIEKKIKEGVPCVEQAFGHDCL